MKPKNWQISLTIACLILGVLFSWQYQLQAASNQPGDENMTIINVIKDLEQENNELENEISALNESINKKKEESSHGAQLTSDLQKTNENLRFLAGLTPVEGPGIKITLDDNNVGAKAAENSGKPYNPEEYLIHDRNVLYIINELKANGAEAIAVNDQRIIERSTVRCVGTVILVNSARLAPPYVIEAIGNPDFLMAAMNESDEITYLKAQGFPISTTKEELLQLPPYVSMLKTEYLKPLAEEDENE